MMFCELCHDETEVIIIEINNNRKISEQKIHYIGNDALCISCHAYVYVSDVHDFNLGQINKEIEKRKSSGS